ncbi:Ldh family oxidoreductase [Xylanibacillus composti]|uniref:Malate dehydrogenase n=1 Tax=Xylanibacillus composti TaxID=1572762 RepID=A0A8J4M114_9BACL|nr:Ldh family oxidoreductase [Xylanibacillus composti]MDT9726198.1 Ldh family oxidoreductase [Xylanibacillus composti]GIQ68044.1 malate dehydrogenase [Xylanibacillus composti]
MREHPSVRVQRADLRRFVQAVFQSCGVPEPQSRTAAEVLCYADENGFDTHGVANLERIYVARLQDGRVDPLAAPAIVAETPATAVLDANDGLGLVAGARAMELAMEKARQTGIGCVVVRRSSHFGSAGYYTQQAQDAGMIGMAMTNLGSQTIARPLGGSVNMIGTNPIAVSAPAGQLPPFVLDMSTTVVATGKIRAAQRRGEAIPEGWLIDDEGQPVTDPRAYDEGTGHLQMLGGALETGGAKGYGLGLMVDIFCGILSGANVGPDPMLLRPEGQQQAKEDQNIGHFFLALHVEAFCPQAEFRTRMDSMLQTLLNCPAAAPATQVVYPGYLEAMGRRDGNQVQLDGAVFEQLASLAKRLGLNELPMTREVVQS